jgi:phage tail sheath gpL-like
MASGSGVPVLTTPLANCGSMPFDWIAGPYADATSLDAIKTFLDDVSGRWSPSQQLYGHYFTYLVGNLSAQATLGNARNNRHETIVGGQSFRTPPWEQAAADGALALVHLSTAPELSRPLQTLVKQNVLPPFSRALWWAVSDRQVLYADGIAADIVNPDGTVSVDRRVTTYKTNAAGAPDATFRDVETLAQCMFATRFLRTAVQTQHGRKAFAAENPFHVAEVVTPDDLRNTLIHAYNDLVALGVVQDSSDFASFLVVQVNPSDPNRADAYLPIEVVNQLRVFAANVTAFLQFASPSGAPLAALANP